MATVYSTVWAAQNLDHPGLPLARSFTLRCIAVCDRIWKRIAKLGQPVERSWSDLPEVLVYRILSHLDESSAKGDAKCARLVCRNWASIVFDTRSSLTIGYNFPLAELHRFPNVTKVTWQMSGSDGLNHLSHLPLLASVNFNPIEFPLFEVWDEEIKLLSTELLSHCPEIRSVSISVPGVNRTDDSLKLLWPLAHCLTALDLRGCSELSDEGMAHLLKLNALRYLNVQNCCNITQESLDNLMAANLFLGIKDSLLDNEPDYASFMDDHDIEPWSWTSSEELFSDSADDVDVLASGNSDDCRDHGFW
eukprot:scaffold22781_cov31-Prasinocladus_malaysianus.AAC.1